MGVVRSVAQEERGRIASLDALRGTGALLVVLQHTWPASWMLQSPGDHTFFLSLGRIGVAAFFMVSGYVIPFSFDGRDTISSFWIKRFFRLWPAYWLAIVVACLVQTPQAMSLAPWQLVLNVTMLQQFFLQPNAVSVFWTLQIELCFYVLVTFMVTQGILFSPRWNAASILGFSAMSVGMGYLRMIWQIPLPVALPISLALMFLGTRIRFVRLGLARDYAAHLFMAMAGIGIACHLAYNSGVNDGDNGWRFIVAYALAALLFLLFERRSRVPSWMAYLGVISYSVYVLHPAVLHVTDMVVGPGHIILLTLIDVPLTIAVAALAYYWVERSAQNYGRRLARSRRPSLEMPDGRSSDWTGAVAERGEFK